METLRLAIITETLPPVRLNLQPWRYLGDLAESLAKEGHEVTFVAREAEATEWRGIPIDREASSGPFRSGRGLRDLVETRGLDGGLFRLTASLFFSMREPPRDASARGRLAGIFLRPVYGGMDLARRFLDPELVQEIFLDRHHAALYVSRRLGTWRCAPSYVDEFVFLWDSDRQSAVAAGLPADRCSVVRHPFDPFYLSREPPTIGPRLSGELRSVPRRIVFAGPPEGSRGFGDLVRAARFLPREPPSQLLLLLRDPAYGEPVVTRTRSGPHEVVTVRGLVTREEIRGIYRASHVAVYPYRFVRTALPLVALEAAAAGLPVVTTRVHPLRELEGRTGLIFAEPRHPRSIAGAIAMALDQGRRPEFDGKNREWIQASPTWQDVAKSFVSALRR